MKNILVFFILCISSNILTPTIVTSDLFFTKGSILLKNATASFIETIDIDQVEENITILIYPFTSFANGTNKQIISDYTPKVSPKPSKITVYKDELDNKVIKLFFKRMLSKSIIIESKFVLDSEVNIFTPSNFYKYPLTRSMTRNVAIYLTERRMSFINDKIKKHVKKLITNNNNRQDNQFNVVVRVLTWVQNNIKLNLDIKDDNAENTFRLKQGNHNGILNLTLAMLRSIGIPSRFVHGFSINKSFAIIQKRSLKENNSFDNRKVLIAPFKQKDNFTISYPKSTYNWIEIYFPNLHWTSFDLFSSYFLIPPNLIRRNISLDSSDGVNKAFSKKIYENKKKNLRLSLKSFISSTKEMDTIKIIDYKKTAQHLMLPNLGHTEKNFINKIFPTKMPTTKNTKHDKKDKAPYSYKEKLEFDPYPLDFDDKLKQIEVRLQKGLTYSQDFFLKKNISLASISLPLFRFNNYPFGKVWIEIQKTKDKKFILKSKEKDIRTMNNSGFYSFILFDFPSKPILEKGAYSLSFKSSTKEIILWRGIFGNAYYKNKDTFYEINNTKTFLYLDLCFKIQKQNSK